MKKQIFVSGMMAMVLVLGGTNQASGYHVVEFPVCMAHGLQWVPAISGNIVVWEDIRTMDYMDIYGYDLSRGTEFYITTPKQAASGLVAPDISGDIVVWAEYMVIYGYDLSEQTKFTICAPPGPWYRFYPAISGDIVVWQDERNAQGYWDIYGYNLSKKEEFPVCTDPEGEQRWQQYPAISGNIVVWQQDASEYPYWDIYGNDLSEPNVFEITSGGEYPAISSDTVVWMDNRTGKWDIYGRDLSEPNEFPICMNSADQWYPAISGDIVVWMDNRNGGWDIYGYDISRGEEFPICTGGPVQQFPAISGNIVVWCDERNSPYGDIYGAYISLHDQCADAIEVAEGVPYSGSTVGATGTDQSSCGYNDVNDVWFSFTPEISADYTISLCGSTFNTTLAVFDGCEGMELACNDDYCDLQSELALYLTAQNIYLIRVAGYDGQTGKYVLKVDMITYDLTITATAGGTTEPAPGTYTYPGSSSVEVNAIPDPNYVFDHWQLDGNDVDSANPYSVVMDSNHTLHPVFFLAKACFPSPADGAEDVATDVVLNWSPGAGAADVNGHDVYFGTDKIAVEDANRSDTTGIYRGRQDVNSYDTNDYDPNGLELGATYYWRIDEVNDPNVWKGDIWQFMVNHIVVDDFDSYVDDWDMWAVWHDWVINDTGSEIYLETDPNFTRVGNSMRYTYDNAGPAPPPKRYSEIEADTAGLEIDPNWTAGGVKALTLYFFGDPCNSATENDQMYVALEDGSANIGVVEYYDMNDVKEPNWHEWNIDLQDFNDLNNVDLTDVNKVYIGFGVRGNTTVPGGEGTVYFDDIRLYPPRCVPEYAYPYGDITSDCAVDYKDVKTMAGEWLSSGIKADIVEDSNVNFKDFAVLADNWLKEILWPFE